MPAKKRTIDRDKLRVAIRRMGNQYVYHMLDDAIELLPPSTLAKLAGQYLDVKSLESDPKVKKHLLDQVSVFEKASLAGDYYESFSVNSKNYREMSAGTQAWIAECERLLDRCVTEVAKGKPGETREAIETIFGLLRHIDECLDDVIFFADEGGSWQVGVDWRKVLPAWFVCLSATTEPDEYAGRVIEVVDEFVKYDRDKHLLVARQKATPAQNTALAQTLSQVERPKAGKRQ